MPGYTPVSARGGTGGTQVRPAGYVPVSARAVPTIAPEVPKQPGLLSRGISKVKQLLTPKPKPYATLSVGLQPPKEPFMTPLPKPSAPVYTPPDLSVGLKKVGDLFGMNQPKIQPGSDLERIIDQGGRAKEELDTAIRGAAKPIMSKVDELAKGVEESISPVTGDRERNFGDVVNVLPAMFRMLANPALDITEAVSYQLYGETGGEVKLPAFNKERIVARGVQTDYEQRLAAGQTPNQAFWGSALGLGIDLSILVPIARSITKLGVANVSPTSLLKETKFNTKQLREWIATGEPMPKDLQEAFKALPDAQKAGLVRGLVTEIREPTPSKLGRILGVSEQEAKTIFDQLNKSTAKSIEVPKQLPGEVTAPKPAIKPTVIARVSEKPITPVAKPYVPVQARTVAPVEKPVTKAQKPTLTIKPTVPTEEIKIAGKTIPAPEQLVTKTGVKDMLKGIGKESVDFVVSDIGGTKFMTYKDGKTNIKIRPSAFGLVESNIQKGQTITINTKDLKTPGTAFRAVNKEGSVEASLASDLTDGGVNPAKTTDEFKKRIEQLNKFGQSYAILRRTGGLSKKAAGVFRHGGTAPKKGIVHLQDSVALNPRQYMSTLSHELGHGLEYTLTGDTNKDTLRVFGDELKPEIKNKIRDELKSVTDDMVGREMAQKGAGYYYKNTELLARFLQSMFISPGKLHSLAPTALEHFEKNAIQHPIMQEYLEAVYGTIDKGERKHIFLRDMKQTYQKVLGTRVGTMAWNDEMRYRAMKERSKILIEKFVTGKFKGVKDDPEHLFRAAESIKVTKEGEPIYGTRDFQYAKNDKEVVILMTQGYEPVVNELTGELMTELHNGEQMIRVARERYSPEQAKKIFESLSPEGKQLIKDFTASKDEAKDYFNREVIKDVHKINSNLEGWVHHYWEDVPLGMGGDRLKMKVAAAKRQRKGAEGYVEDLKKAMTKALTELENAKAYNAFIEDYFARVSKPIAKGQDAEPGWVEVQGNVKKGGIGRPMEIKRTIIEDGKATPAGVVRYQMPTEVYKRFQMIREVATEASTAMRVINSLNRYWRVNILFHPGSAATNFISGGIQYGTKMLADFYTEVLTGNVKFDKTRKNIYSMLTAITPKGWQEAPDWVYGGDLSNYYGQFGQEKTPGVKILDKGVDAYADKALKLYGAVERYWKKVITLSEKTSNLNDLNKVTREGLKLPTDEEKQMLDEINSDVDLYAYDYENVPVWMENYQQSTLAQAVKPFAKYPYKYAKHLTEMIHQAFDGTLPWQERIAKIMSILTIVATYAYYRDKQHDRQLTKEVSDEAPAQVSTRGRFYIVTDKEGNEMFTRTAKYPFINVSEAGLQFINGNANTGFDIVADMLGSVAPAGQVGLAALGYKNEYQTYVPFEVIAGQTAATFVPGTRILQDIARFFDPYQRKQKTFLQAFTSFVPITDADLQEKLRGEIRTIQVPLEGNVQRRPEEGFKRTTTDMFVRNYKNDVLLGLLGGLYVTRIDPDVANAFIVRKEENEKEKARLAEKKAYVEGLMKKK